MCGLFGSIRHPAADPHRAAELLALLGPAAEERGVDAGGIAFASTPAARPGPVTYAAQQADLRCGDWQVTKAIGPVRQLWQHPDLPDALGDARAVLGHTRLATQGATDRLVNTSPLVIDGVIGCHNGDIDAAALRSSFPLPPTMGETDTESLLQALSTAGGQVGGILNILPAVVGRAALTWVDHGAPGIVFLARAGLSPLTVGRDDHNNLFWASNPRWLRAAAAKVGACITRSVPIPEGTLLAIRIADATMAGHWRFTPTVRATDCATAHFAAWRHFEPADRRRDQQGLRHLVLKAHPQPRSAAALPIPQRAGRRAPKTCRCRQSLVPASDIC